MSYWHDYDRSSAAKQDIDRDGHSSGDYEGSKVRSTHVRHG